MAVVKLSEFIKNLQLLEEQGHGNLEVYYELFLGDKGTLSNANVATVGPCEGPYDLDEGEQYICVYAGN